MKLYIYIIDVWGIPGYPIANHQPTEGPVLSPIQFGHRVLPLGGQGLAVGWQSSWFIGEYCHMMGNLISKPI